MAKIAGGQFKVGWDLPSDADVVGTMLYFGATPEEINYTSPSVMVKAPVNSFNYPADLIPDEKGEVKDPVPKSTGSFIYVKVAAVDGASNISDLTEALQVPFDITPPGVCTNLRLL